MEAAISLVVVFAGIFAAYRLHDYLMFRTENAIWWSFGLVLACLLVAGAINFGLWAIVPELYLLASIGSIAAVVRLIGERVRLRTTLIVGVAMFVLLAWISVQLGIDMSSEGCTRYSSFASNC